MSQDFRAESLPFAFVLDAEQQRLAVAGGKYAIRVDARVVGPAARRRGIARVGVIEWKSHPFGHGFEQGNGDMRTLAGSAALDQRREDGGVGLAGGGDVGDGNAALDHDFAVAGDREKARFRLHEQVVGLLFAPGAVVAVTADVANDQSGIIKRQLCI